MALSNVHFIGIFILFVGLINSGEGIRCYQCKSETDYNCRDPFNFTHFHYNLVDCDRISAHSTYLQSYAVCKKVVHRVNGDYQVERSCAWEQAHDRYNNRACSGVRSSPYATVEHCSTCFTDACNDGNAVIPAVTTIAVTAISYLGSKFM